MGLGEVRANIQANGSKMPTAEAPRTLRAFSSAVYLLLRTKRLCSPVQSRHLVFASGWPQVGMFKLV